MESYNIGLLETIFFHLASCPRFIHVAACQNFLFLRPNNIQLGFFWLLWIMLPWIWTNRYLFGHWFEMFWLCTLMWNCRITCEVSVSVFEESLYWFWCSKVVQPPFYFIPLCGRIGVQFMVGHICSLFYLLMGIWILCTFWFVNSAAVSLFYHQFSILRV